MPVSLIKTPRPFTVLTQDGTVHAVIPTPGTQEARDALYIEAVWGDCLDLFEVTAADHHEATIRAINTSERAQALQEHMDFHGVSYGRARTAYLNLHAWLRRQTPETRATWLADYTGPQHSLIRFAAREAMREFGEIPS
ncbi:hypothetical protein ACWD4V_01215 [Streptomyces tsukubensis]